MGLQAVFISTFCKNINNKILFYKKYKRICRLICSIYNLQNIYGYLSLSDLYVFLYNWVIKTYINI